MDSPAKRLYQALQLRHMKAVDLHSRTGINKSSISQYLSGRVKQPQQDKIRLMAEALDVSELWLLGADVPMEREGDFGGYVLKSDAEKEHIEKYRAISDEGRGNVDNVLEHEYKKAILESEIPHVTHEDVERARPQITTMAAHSEGEKALSRYNRQAIEDMLDEIDRERGMTHGSDV